MTSMDRVRSQLPPEWRRIDLKKLLGDEKAEATRLIDEWHAAGYIEDVPGTNRFRFVADFDGTGLEGLPDTAEQRLNLTQVREFVRTFYPIDGLRLPDWSPRPRLPLFTSQTRREPAPAAEPEPAPGDEPSPLTRVGTEAAHWLRQAARVAAEHAAALAQQVPLRVWMVAGVVVMVLLALTTTVMNWRSAAATEEPLTLAMQPTLPTLPQPLVAWYGPGGEIFGAVAAGTPYMPVARFGADWVQLDLSDTGMLWVRSGDVAALPGVNLAQLDDLRPPVAGYGVHVVAPGETLRSIAERGGSDTTLIRSYNRLEGEPLAGQPLLVPRMEGYASTLPPEPLLVRQGSTAQPRVALTIDLETGDADVARMLDTLREHDARITFFVLAAWVEQHPELAQRMAAEGHEFASHSLTHASFPTLSDAQIVHELAETERIVQEVTGATTRPFFRPPYGHYDDRVLLRVIEQGYLPIYWSVDPGDASGAEKSPEYLIEHITAVDAPEELYGAVVLGHCCTRTTMVDALPSLLTRLGKMGLQVRPLSEVLGP